MPWGNICTGEMSGPKLLTEIFDRPEFLLSLSFFTLCTFSELQVNESSDL